MNPIIFTSDAASQLCTVLHTAKQDNVFVLCDDNTVRDCLPKIATVLSNRKEKNVCAPESEVQTISLRDNTKCSIITIPSGDTHKTIESLTHVWQQMQHGGATRHSLLINLGGGMVTDLGGFAASTFKRGIRFINIPTTLLSMVDASVGGKTGINFGGLKNEIGTFCQAQEVIIDTSFLSTLDNENILSGYAEMLKHALLSSTPEWAELLNIDPTTIEPNLLSTILQKNIHVKERIVEADPHEQNLRKALNLGHTIGHALESFAMSQARPVPHGYAVAWGLICELYLSAIKLQFPTDKLRQTVTYIRSHYGSMPLECKHYDTLFNLMTHDKKNIGSTINFTLLADIGDIRLDQTATRNEILESLDFLREAI